MGDLERAAVPHLSRAATVAWWTILGASLAAIGVGFAGGRSIGSRALAPPPPIPRGALPPAAAVRPRVLPRMLTGARSFDAADPDVDPYGDPERSVAARPPGGPAPHFDRLRDRPRVAVIVVDADRSESATLAFAQEPFALAIALAPATAPGTFERVRAAGKTVLTACEGVAPPDVAAARNAGADGIMCSTGDPARAAALAGAAHGGLVVDDLLHGEALTGAARRAHLATVSRDVVADARDEPFTVDFLLAQGLAIAWRTGTATIAVHARPGSRAALERFVARAEREGVDIVDVGGIARR